MSNDSKFAAAGYFDGTIRVWNLDNRAAEPVVIPAHSDIVTENAFLPDGKTLASVSTDGSLRLWEYRASDASQAPQSLALSVKLTSLAMSPDGKWLAFGCEDGTARMLNLNKLGEMPTVFRSGEKTIESVSFSPDGTTLVTSTEPLGAYPARLTDRLLHWASVSPEHTLAAKRVHGGDWRRISYAEAVESAKRIAQWLLDLGLSAQHPLAILSDNDLEHLLLGLGAMFAGVPFAPISPAYSTVSQDYGKLRHILGVLTPGLVFASSASGYGRAIQAVVPASTPVVLAHGEIEGRHTLAFDELLARPATSAVDAAHAKVGPDSIAKFLFTSGSTKLPKGVINTQRMLCANQQQILQCFPGLGQVRPVLVDWLPWNHTFGGNHNVGLTIYNGGTLYIDEGKPTPALIHETLRNLREISPTVYFNVPKGFEEIARAMDSDTALRDMLFSRVKAFMFAGAGLSQAVWDQLDRHALAATGQRICIFSGLGMTETSPSCTFALGSGVKSGDVGLPAPGTVAARIVAAWLVCALSAPCRAAFRSVLH